MCFSTASGTTGYALRSRLKGWCGWVRVVLVVFSRQDSGGRHDGSHFDGLAGGLVNSLPNTSMRQQNHSMASKVQHLCGLTNDLRPAFRLAVALWKEVANKWLVVV
ncbi:MAG: hypothetical protein Q4D98_13835 [Planctomycetia bacterium]|nr:hypothetical protein [Planctomycetia bacterium]